MEDNKVLPPSSGLRLNQASNNKARGKEVVGKILPENMASFFRK
jgi:hypothetical protein